MRKIWSSRKDRDKRKSMNPEPSAASASAASAAASTTPAKLAIAPPSASAPAPDHLARLVRPEWDSTPMKHQWLNVAHGATAHSGDIESAARAYRAELKGSHLYLYKAQQFKRFTLDDSAMPSTPLTPKVDKFDDMATLASGAGTAVASIAPSGAPSGASAGAGASSAASIGAPTLVGHSGATAMGTAASVASSHATTTTEPYSQTNFSTATLDEPQGFTITHFSPQPHPALQRNPETGKFGVTAVEALVHYMLFGDDAKAVASVINILPIVPQFSQVMQLIGDFVAAIADGRFGTVDRVQVGERILQLLANIEANFGGFLLKKDTASLILSVMEEIQKPTFAQDAALEGRLVQFKSKMLVKQQQLMDLIKPPPAPAAAPPASALASVAGDQNPFIELNSLVFMKGNLFELAHAISKIDQQYFHQWNSNIDKSLLLISSLSEASGAPNFYKRNPLLFNNDVHIHYLSRLLIHHLFVETSSTLERKARLLEKWIDLGCLLDKSGNMSSWLGISSVILSQPVLRLIKVWSLVSSDYVKLLKNDWCPVLFELDRRHLATDRKPDDEGGADNLARDSYHIMAPRGLGKIYAKEHVIPYFGDLVINNDNPDPHTVNVDELQAVWKRINYSFSRWNEYLANLTNYTDIIKYNEEVLQRYDAMGFIFSNESLNQVLYLGVNGTLDDPPTPQNSSSPQRDDGAIDALHLKLVRLIDINTESINLDKIMKLSLELEPDLPESYLKPPEKPHGVFAHNHSSSSVSVHSVESGVSLVQPSMISGPLKPERGANRLPSFNNDYLKVNLDSYETPEPLSSGDLVFRIEGGRDTTNGTSTSTTQNPAADDEDDDVPGLGIDVDDLLNSDKWRAQRRDPGAPTTSTEDTTTTEIVHARHVPRAGTIDKLIDLLLIDAKYFEDGVHIDLTEYRFVFLLNYNSFISTKDLLDKLAYRFINSGNAVISIMKQMSPSYQVPPGEFPNWQLDTSVDLKELGSVDYELLLKIQINILKVLIVLINNFYGNFSVELINKSILIKLLKLFSNEILQWYNSNKIASQNLEKSFENLVNYYKKLKKLFVKKSYRPVEISKFDEYLINEFKFNNSLHEVPINRNLPGHKNTVKIDKFLSKFNKLLTVFYRGITIDDWMKVNKALESLFERNQLLDFNLQKSSTPEEFVIVSNVFNYFESLVDQDKSLILKKFPLVFRKLFKLFFKFRSYLLIQLTDANISVEERLDRMKTLLIMVRISQDKMRHAPQVFEGDNRNHMIPSCIETAVTTVIYSPESRVFSQYWLRAAASFFDDPPQSFDNLESLLPPSVPMDDAAEPLLPCFGWIIENLLQINTIPSFVDGSVINFSKRYLVFRFLKSVEAPDVVGDVEPSADDTREFDFLLKLDEALVAQSNLTIGDYRDPHSRESRRLFRSVLSRQHDILLRDYKKKQMRDQMTHFSGPTPPQSSPYVTSLSSTNNILTKKTSQSSLRRQSLSYKSNSSSRFKISGFFSKSRPFSLNGGHHSNQQPAPPVAPPASSTQPPPVPIADRVVSERELPNQPDIDPKQKPSVVITLKNRKIFPVYLTPLCFKIDGDNGDDFFFQARSEPDFNDWLVKLSFANRHWFFSRMLNHAKISSNLTFGVPLAVAAARDAALVPKVLTEMMKYVEDEGINDVGVYRISCSLSELTQLKQSIDTTGTIDLSPDNNVDVHAVTSVLKSYLRELPDALLTDSVIEGLFAVKSDGDDPIPVTAIPDYSGPGQVSSSELHQYSAVLKNLPTTNYHTLRVLLRHLTTVATHQATNKMTPSNLATVIGPALTEASSLDSLVNKFGYINQVLEKMIVNSEVLFDPDYAQTSKQQIMGGGTIATVTGTPVTPAYPSTIIGTPVLNHHSRPAHSLDKIDDADEREGSSDAEDSSDEAVPHHSHGRVVSVPESEDEDPVGTIVGSASPPSVDASGLPTPTIDDEDYSVNA